MFIGIAANGLGTSEMAESLLAGPSYFTGSVSHSKDA